jgi:hypothetical protein
MKRRTNLPRVRSRRHVLPCRRLVKHLRHRNPHCWPRYLLWRSAGPSGAAIAPSERGEARLEDGRLVLPLSEHQGTIQLTLEGDTLKGSGDVKGKTGTMNLKRAAHGR